MTALPAGLSAAAPGPHGSHGPARRLRPGSRTAWPGPRHGNAPRRARWRGGGRGGVPGAGSARALLAAGLEWRPDESSRAGLESGRARLKSGRAGRCGQWGLSEALAGQCGGLVTRGAVRVWDQARARGWTHVCGIRPAVLGPADGPGRVLKFPRGLGRTSLGPAVGRPPLCASTPDALAECQRVTELEMLLLSRRAGSQCTGLGCSGQSESCPPMVLAWRESGRPGPSLLRTARPVRRLVQACPLTARAT